MDEEAAKGSASDDDGLKTSVSLAELRGELYRLRLAAGQPSFRAMAQKTGWSRATVGRVFSGESVPKWDVLEAVVGYLGGNTEKFRQLWIECMGVGAQPAHTSTTSAAEEPVRRGLTSYVAGACLMLLFIVVSVQGLAPSNASRNQTITDAAQLGFGLAAASLWAVVFAKRKEGRALALALGLAGWSGGQAYWLAMRDIFDNPIPAAPSIGDLSYLLLPACVIPGLVAALPPKLRWPCAGVLVAMMFSTTTAAALALLFFIRGPAGAAVVYALYIVTDLTMLVLLGWMGRRERSWPLAVAFCGVAVLLISDTLFVYFAWWRPQNAIPYGADVGYMIFPLAMSIAASYTLEKR
ncbi:helix-turn-helix domain-containing protein [Mycobacterium avium subsp. hominissuis]|uniref:helix-turn-helix domain-containing protein n=1 Tax=Mycobacterium TaxID=1763 RepID=UPI000A1560B2|nr:MULTISPECIES: helix-turn-helix transcriptional regulator [Mycobacterium]MBZ4508566.1 helix-turn-helix domain-containing protein [Mycobacterium avium subsp. hominissuis]ORX13074.1 hypothetical protein AWC32_15745 [Mycobacterium xenopi]SPX94922.1 Uncharacterised protein [Mycobacterium xenopi]